MNHHPSDLTPLIAEYKPMVNATDRGDSEALTQELVANHDWTPWAAETLTVLANDYGTFILRNALALALVLDKEDGDLGF